LKITHGIILRLKRKNSALVANDNESTMKASSDGLVRTVQARGFEGKWALCPMVFKNPDPTNEFAGRRQHPWAHTFFEETRRPRESLSSCTFAEFELCYSRQLQSNG